MPDVRKCDWRFFAGQSDTSAKCSSQESNSGQKAFKEQNPQESYKINNQTVNKMAKTTQELKERYMGLYDYMVQSKNPKNMKAFGCVMTEMMDVMLAKLPVEAEEMIDQLESIKWHQYLSRRKRKR